MFIKARFGGERQWCEVLDRLPDERLRVRVKNVPACDGAAFDSEHVIFVEEILDALMDDEYDRLSRQPPP